MEINGIEGRAYFAYISPFNRRGIMAKQDSPQQWAADFKAYLEFIRDEEKIKAVNLRAETVAALRRRPAAAYLYLEQC